MSVWSARASVRSTYMSPRNVPRRIAPNVLSKAGSWMSDRGFRVDVDEVAFDIDMVSQPAGLDSS